MKSSIVPAQITTVEDKIAGNLTLQQMILLAMPVFVNFALYATLPKSLKLSAYKVVLMVLVALTCGLLSIRIKGKILLIWITTIISYNLRPRYYVFNKNDAHLRVTHEHSLDVASEDEQAIVTETATMPEHPAISTADIVRLEGILANPAAKLSFNSYKKGGLHVRITEVES